MGGVVDRRTWPKALYQVPGSWNRSLQLSGRRNLCRLAPPKSPSALMVGEAGRLNEKGLCRDRQSPLNSGGELSKLVAVLFSELPQSPVAQLPDALSSYPQHSSDLLERTTIPIVETEIQAQHLGISRRQRSQS